MEQVWVTEKEKVRSNIMQKVNVKKTVTNIPSSEVTTYLKA